MAVEDQRCSKEHECERQKHNYGLLYHQGPAELTWQSYWSFQLHLGMEMLVTATAAVVDDDDNNKIITAADIY